MMVVVTLLHLLSLKILYQIEHVVPLIHGGTGADDASGARTNLGLGTLATANSVAVGNLASNIDATDINFIAAKAAELETARTIHGVSFDGSANIDLSEVIQDTVGAMFSSNTETNITATYQDSGGTIDLVADLLTEEAVEDFVAGAITAGSNVSVTYDDAAGTITIASTDTNTQLTQEQVEDFVGGMVSGNTETLITVTYEDSDGTIDFVVDNDLANYDNTNSGFITATLTQEQVEDFVGGMLDGTETLISVSYDDTDGNIDFVVDNDLSNYSNTNSAFITLTSLSGGTGVTYNNATGAISIGQAVGTSSDVQFNDVTVAGDLTVNGTTTTVSSTNTEIADKLIELANGTSGTPSGDAGLVIEKEVLITHL